MYKDYFENIIPNLIYKDIQHYIIEDSKYSYADFITNSKNKVIDYFQDNDLELVEIKFEKNNQGLDDFRLIYRKRSTWR